MTTGTGFAGGAHPPGKAAEERRRARGDFERRWHARILHEPRAERRAALYEEAYGRLYDLWAAEAPGKAEFGFQQVYADVLEPLARGSDILDFGCGFGSSTLRFAAFAARATGLESNDRCVEGARRAAAAAGARNVAFVKSAGAALPFPDEAFDLVYSNDVAEHLHPDDLAAHAREARRVLRPGGSCVCVTPNRLFGPHDVSKTWLRPGSPPEGLHLREYATDELGRVFIEAGFARAEAPLFALRIERAFARGAGVVPRVAARLRGALERALARSRLCARALGLETVALIATRP